MSKPAAYEAQGVPLPIDDVSWSDRDVVGVPPKSGTFQPDALYDNQTRASSPMGDNFLGYAMQAHASVAALLLKYGWPFILVAGLYGAHQHFVVQPAIQAELAKEERTFQTTFASKGLYQACQVPQKDKYRMGVCAKASTPEAAFALHARMSGAPGACVAKPVPEPYRALCKVGARP